MTDLLYLAAGLAFIAGLKGLTSPRTARTGNAIAASGMLTAIVVTLVDQEIIAWGFVVAGLAVGAIVGALLALRVQMTDMPQLVAIFNGFGGLASALVAMSELRSAGGSPLATDTATAMVVSIAVGAVTFTGSLIAFGKLQTLLPGRPLVYHGSQIVNTALGTALIAFAVWGVITDEPAAFWTVGGLGLALGVLAVVPIGGADMPVVISLLNSFSGIAAAATGFVIDNNALIIGGALVGSAGLILTALMTQAMNRSLTHVLFAGFGTGGSVVAASADEDRRVNSATADDVAIALGYAESVIIVPGYGLAVAQAQHATDRLASELRDRGVAVHYAIHPVAGRMPGHMNVLLAEADVPYELMIELDEANSDFPRTDVVLVLGANDVVNPAARDDPSSTIYGMPILNVDHAGTVVVVKRSLSTGFAGIDNSLFYEDNTLMYFGDAKGALEDVTTALESV
ncbi:MAG: NAD(P)(+) transhydrogenase (Re/Si-specific) subunit beta [Acidimicrobiales bacterium]